MKHTPFDFPFTRCSLNPNSEGMSEPSTPASATARVRSSSDVHFIRVKFDLAYHQKSNEHPRALDLLPNSDPQV